MPLIAFVRHHVQCILIVVILLFSFEAYVIGFQLGENLRKNLQSLPCLEKFDAPRFILSSLIVGTLAVPGRATADFDDIDLGPILPGRCRQVTASSGVTTISCRRFGLDRDLRLLSCNPNENCVSTSAIKVPSKYSSPWTYFTQTDRADRAWRDLVSLVENDSLSLGLTVVEIDNDRYYLRATAPSKVPPASSDDIEFLVKPADNIVLYRYLHVKI